jgi:hypothetical protein
MYFSLFCAYYKFATIGPCDRKLSCKLNCKPQGQRSTAISIKVVHEQSGKVEYERERLLGIAMKIH